MPPYPPELAQAISRAAELLKNSRRVLLAGHPAMDGDALGSVFFLYHVLSAQGVECLPLSQDDGPGKYAFLEGTDRLARLEDQPGRLEGFDCAVILDVGAQSRARRVLDRLAPGAKVVNLDHHIDNPGFGDVAVVLPHASSTGEVVFEVAQAAGFEISRAAAEALFVAIVTDTGRFSFSNSTPRAFRIIAELIERHGLDVNELTRRIYRSKSRGRIRLEAMVAESIETRCEGRIVSATVTQEMLNATGCTAVEAAEVVAVPKALRGGMICVYFREQGPEEMKVSLRSEGQMAVNDIAAKFGGGGHLRAAGFHSRGRPVEVVREELLAELEAGLSETLARTGGAVIV